MLTKYVIEVNERTQDLCMFLNDGLRPEVYDQPTWLVLTIDGPREITSKLQHESEPLSGDSEDTYIFLK